mmetsp:Transcript_5855/g.9060  ORF Transcript_5855/g.9060 Transcript_5855/m.9060 type:complete len:341 (-) Transcript_5855:463-1485(-)
MQQINEITNHIFVRLVDKRSGKTCLSSTTGTTNTMNVLVDVGWHVKVHNMDDIADVKTTRSHIGRNQEATLATLKLVESHLTLVLSAVSMDGDGRKTLRAQKVFERVCRTLGLDKDEGKTLHSGEKINEKIAFVLIGHLDKLLRHKFSGTADATNTQKDIVLEKLGSQVLDFLGKGGRKHECSTLANWRHVNLFHNVANLRFKSHVKHTISFVKHEEAANLERNATTLNDIDKTARCGHQNVALAFKFTQLLTDRSTTIHHHRLDTRLPRKLDSFVENLGGELTGWCDNQAFWVCLAARVVATTTTVLLRTRCWSSLDKLGQNWKEKSSSLSRTSLCTRH